MQSEGQKEGEEKVGVNGLRCRATGAEKSLASPRLQRLTSCVPGPCAGLGRADLLEWATGLGHSCVRWGELQFCLQPMTTLGSRSITGDNWLGLGFYSSSGPEAASRRAHVLT